MNARIRRIAWLAATGVAALCATAAGAETYLGSFQITERADGMVMDAVRNRIWMQANNTLAVVDATTGAATYLPDSLVLSPSGIAVNPVTNKVYVTRSSAGTVVEVDGDTRAVTLLATTPSPYGVAVNAATNRIYVANSGAGTVTVIDGATHATSTVTVGASPTHVEVDSVANRVYVANSAGASVTVIDGATLATSTIPIGSNPGAIAVDAASNRIYVINGINGVTVINGTTTATTHVATAPGPVSLAVNPVTHKVYVANSGATPTVNGIVTIIDGATLGTISVAAGANCCSIAVNPVTNRIYAVGAGYFAGLFGGGGPLGKLTMIDGATNAATTIAIDGGSVVVNPVTNRIFVSHSTIVSTAHLGQVHVVDGNTHSSVNIAAGAGPGAVATNPASGAAYAISYDDNTLTLIDASNQTVTFPTGMGPLAVAVDALINRVYVANQDSASVTVINGALPGTTTVAVGNHPVAIAVNPVTHKVYVANQLSNSVSVIDANTLAVVTVAVGAAPVALAVDPVLDRIYVASDLAGAITIIDGATNTTTSVPTALYTSAIAVNPRTGKVYAMSVAGRAVTVIDGSFVSSIPVADTGEVIAINPATNTIYVANTTPNLTVIDGATGATRSVPLAESAMAIAISVARDRVYLANGTNRVDVLAGNATAVADGITVGIASHRIAVDPATEKVFVSNAGSGSVTVITPAPSSGNPLSSQVAPLPGNRTTSPAPTLDVVVSNSAGSTTLGVLYQVDTMTGPWLRASGSGPFQATLSGLKSGSHVLYAYAIDASVASLQGSPFVGRMAAYLFTVAQSCATSTCVDVTLAQSATPAVAGAGKDVVLQLTATNLGPGTATNVVLRNPLPDNSAYVWATPPCTLSSGAVTCNLGSLPPGAAASMRLVVRPIEAGTLRNTAVLTANELDAHAADNSSALTIGVNATPAGTPVLRYRLYSPVTLEHHFTTDLNEYTVLAANGNWTAEGTVGKVLNNPGAFNGVTAIPYYRLYNSAPQWHHWTTDPNEYYTLIQFPGWNGEGVDAYIFPSQPAGTIPLYRLLYPFVPGLHHWTIDANEYNTLITPAYGWIGEGGSGFVIQ